jgi:hypothetical protein
MHDPNTMSVRITLYEAALEDAVNSGGENCRHAAIDAFAKAEQIFRTVHRLRKYGAPNTALLGLLVLAVYLTGWGYLGFRADYWLLAAVESGMGAVAILFGLSFLCLSLWDILLVAEKFRLTPARLKAQALKPFRSVLDRCVDGTTPAFDRDGKRIDGPVLQSHWSLILFSQHPAHRSFRLPSAMRIIDEQPIVEAATRGDVIPTHARQPVEQDAEQVTHTVINYTQTTNTVILQKHAVAATERVARQAKQRKAHWFASVTTEMFEMRATKIASHWSGSQEQQVRMALNTGYAITRADQRPDIPLKELEAKIVRALEQAQLPVGLQQTPSSVWINKMFGEGKRHDYVWVRRYLTEPDFAPPYELPLSA